MTKRDSNDRAAAWQHALRDGRVLRINAGERFISYPTIAQRDAALTTLRGAGALVEIVEVQS
jgi:hypothetical protein